MARQQRPGLSDFMQIAQGFGNIAQQHRQAEAHDQRMAYMDQQQEHMAWQREQAKTQEGRKKKVQEAAGIITDHLARGGDPGEVSQVLPEDMGPEVRHNAMVGALKVQREKEMLSEAQMKRRAMEIGRQHQEFQTMLQRSHALLQSGDTDGFYDMAKAMYNNYVYDGLRIKDMRETDEGRVLTVETVDGQTDEIIDDLTPQEVFEQLAQQAQDPKQFFQQYTRAKMGVREHNAEAMKWDNLERVTDEDGNIMYAANLIDNESLHPVRVYLKEDADGFLKPVDVDGQTALSKDELALVRDARETHGSGIENLTTNQALSELEKFFFREGGLLGEVQRMTENPDEQYWVAQQKFNDIIRQAQAGETEATPYEAALMARDYVMRMEDEFWQEVAENPDNREQIEQDFREMFGYVPAKGGGEKELERRREKAEGAGKRLGDYIGRGITGP